MAKVYLGLGSNVGNRALNIYSALRRLQDEIQLDRISSLYETQPVGYTDQPWFLNLVCAGETQLSPQHLLVLAKRIERAMGRKQGIRFGPRSIDIDVLFYENLIMDTPQLEIPHPRLAERGFVLIPLNEVAPGLLHPRLKVNVQELLDNATPPHDVRLYTLRDSQASD
jgi:2-amino-4-hydroxy-6-hydroxymethyldihydropteridine diphosphokinase